MTLRFKIQIFLLPVVLAVILVGLSVLWSLDAIEQPIQTKDTIEIEVASGTSLKKLINAMDDQGLINNDVFLKAYIRVSDKYKNIKVGVYEAKPLETLDDFLTRVVNGKVKLFSLTLIEGLTWKQWKQQILAHPAIIDDLDESELLSNLQIEGNSLEGWLLPETYALTKPASASEFVTRLVTEMRTELKLQWQNRQGMLPYQSPYEALIMASIIEKETGLALERPHIAAVFVNRLNIGMRLQTDPTIIYGLGDRFDGDIKRVHLREKTPYNTYVIDGLPPTPIAMPSKLAIIAALNPIQSDDLYFVAKGDGSHQFSKTLAEHNAAVRKYQLKK